MLESEIGATTDSKLGNAFWACNCEPPIRCTNQPPSVTRGEPSRPGGRAVGSCSHRSPRLSSWRLTGPSHPAAYPTNPSHPQTPALSALLELQQEASGQADHPDHELRHPLRRRRQDRPGLCDHQGQGRPGEGHRCRSDPNWCNLRPGWLLRRDHGPQFHRLGRGWRSPPPSPSEAMPMPHRTPTDCVAVGLTAFAQQQPPGAL